MLNQFKQIQESLKYVTESWPADYTSKETTDKMKGASKADITKVEKEIGFKLPKDHVEYLLKRDGGFCNKRHFIILSAGEGLHETETLLSFNKVGLPKHIVIAREATEEFCYQEKDLKSSSSVPNAPVYIYWHDEGSFDKVAESFEKFVEGIYTKDFKDADEGTKGLWDIISKKIKTIKLEQKIMKPTDKMRQVQESLVVNEIFYTGFKVPIIDDIGDYVANKAVSVATAIGGKAQDVEHAIEEPARMQGAQNTADMKKLYMKEGLFRAKMAVKEFLVRNKYETMAVAAVLGGGILGVVANKIWKRYFTEAGKYCSNAPDKKECYKEYQVKAAKMLINQLNASKGKYQKLPEVYKIKAMTNIDNQIKIQKDKINGLIAGR